MELNLNTKMEIRMEELANIQHNEANAESIRDSMRQFLEATKEYVGVTEKRRKNY
jgi:ABC-type Fe3+-hydroxamate transport system substrate-binding protein